MLDYPRRDLHVFYVLDTSVEFPPWNPKDLRSTLLHMRRKFGLEVFRNPARMFSVVNDLSPSLRRDANILRQLGHAGLLKEMEQADEQNRERIAFKARYWLENELFMREEQAAHYAQALEILYQPDDALSEKRKIERKIVALNHAVEDTLTLLEPCKADSDAEDARLLIAMLEFNSECHWITLWGPEDLEENFIYEYLEFGGRESNLGAALRELNSKLSRHGFLRNAINPYLSAVIFITDGHATDDWEDALQEISENPCFRMANKLGIALSDNANAALLSAITGNRGAVIKCADINGRALRRLFWQQDSSAWWNHFLLGRYPD